jgi:hypothetical protein
MCYTTVTVKRDVQATKTNSYIYEYDIIIYWGTPDIGRQCLKNTKFLSFGVFGQNGHYIMFT